MHLSKKLFPAFIGYCLMFSAGYAYSSFDSWKKSQQSAFQQSKDEFVEYKRELDAAFKEYSRKTSAVWGKDNIDPGKKRWVSYIDSLTQRSVVDFEQGTVNVEVALPDTGADEELGKKQLELTLLKAMEQGNDKRPMQKIAEQPVSQPDDRPVLQGQIGLADGAAANQDDYKQLARDAAANATKKTVKGNDGKTRVVFQA